MKNVSILISLLMFAAGCGVVSKGETRLYTDYSMEVVFPWSKDRRLNWDDFLGERITSNKNDHKSAEQEYFISVSKKTLSGKTQYVVINFFLKKHSWVIDPSPLLLEHEQIHFNITELFTRQLRFSLDSLSTLNNDNIEINKILDKYHLRLKNQQQLFDLETNSGKNKVRQSKWKYTIDRKLSLIDSLYIEY